MIELSDLHSVGLIGVGLVYLILGIDDVFIDLVFWTMCRKRCGQSFPALSEGGDFPKTNRMAVAIPAWQEAGVIGRMLLGNLKRIPKADIHYFVGTYPNDPQTCAEVDAIARQFSNVHRVKNRQFGPSSKGQILNVVIEAILEWEREKPVPISGVVLHDAEDVLHPAAFDAIRELWKTDAFVQIPVFSIAREARQWIGGTYMDEFAESHTKDLIVRGYLGAAVPSAGVGTGISRDLLSKLLESQGRLFNEGALTEDYELGHRAFLSGARTALASFRVGGEWIATREYFPNAFWKSVRQKARWTLGIAIQAKKNLGWYGNLVDRYFLWRDRRVIFSNAIGFIGLILVPWILLTPSSSGWKWLWWTNLVLMANRLVQRGVATKRVYGLAAAFWVIPRWPIGVLINAVAAISAVLTHWKARILKTKIHWTKTEHELPQSFGEVIG